MTTPHRQRKRVKVQPIVGWVLISREDDIDANWKTIKSYWYVCWEGVFDTKVKALEFAAKNNWRRPYRAVRGEMRARP